jgi:lysophospholipase L1-like esterase
VDLDPSHVIPVGPVPFERGLPHFARGITRGRPRIVAIGSSTTAGEGNIRPYPDRLLSLLQIPYPNARIAMINAGIGGQEAPIELDRFATDVIAEKPDLVIWQVGTNAVWQSSNVKPPPPTFDETINAIRDGLVKLRNETQADVILMDLQYLPAVLTPAKKGKAIAMVKAISGLAADAEGVNVFRRFAFMEALHEVEGISFDRMVDPGDDTRLHQSDWVTDRVTKALKAAIIDGVDKAWSSAANAGGSTSSS